MTPTKERCVQWARECGAFEVDGKIAFYKDAEELHAFAIKVLAEKENGMIEHYTQEEAVELATACGILNDTAEYYQLELRDFANTAVTRKLAEKELEVVRLREALDLLRSVVVEHNCRGVDWGDLFGNLMSALGNAAASLSTPTSTEALDEYVAEKVKEYAKNMRGPDKSQAGLIFQVKSLEAKLAAADRQIEHWRDKCKFDLMPKLAAAEERVKEYKELCRHSYHDKTFRIQIDYQDLHIREIVSFESAKEVIPHVATGMIVKLLAAIERSE